MSVCVGAATPILTSANAERQKKELDNFHVYDSMQFLIPVRYSAMYSYADRTD